MKKLFLALALVLAPSLAFGQCAGVFPAHTVCGNTSASPNVPTALPFGGTIIGPGTTVVNHFATWGDTTGNTLLDFDLFGSNNIWTGTNTFNSTLSGTGVTSLFASPPAIGGTASAAGKFTTLQATGNFTTNITGSTQCLHVNSSGVVSGYGTDCNSRVKLLAPLTLYVNPSASPANCNGVTCGGGSDVTGDGSLAKPFATREGAIDLLGNSYDLDCQNVTIQLADGTYTDSAQFFAQRLFGQCSPASLIFNGNSTTPSNVLIQPTASAGYTYGFFYGFSALIQNQKLDQKNQFASPGQDILSVGQLSYMYLGNNIIFGCAYPGMGENAISVTTGGQLFLNPSNDYIIDPSSCQVNTTSTFSGSSNTLTLASATGVYAQMGITGTNIPIDAYIGNLVGTTVTLSCIITSPCQTSGSGSGTTTIIFGGGQFFINAGSGGIVYAATNNQSEYTDTITTASSSFFYDMIFANGLSNFNFQGITWINTLPQHGGCGEAVNISLVDTGLAGIPYLPCLSGPSALTETTASLTSGSNQFTVSGGAASSIRVGMPISGYAGPTGTWSAGSNTITLSSATGACIGGQVSGPGILSGGAAKISNLVSTTATLVGCTAGGRCVTGAPTYLSGSGTQLAVTGCGVPNGSWVTAVSGSTITINQAATASGSQTVLFAPAGGGAAYTGVQDSSVYH